MLKLKGNSVVVGQDENIERALRRFKKKIQNSGILDELRAREFYEKPTTERKRKKAAAAGRWRKYLRSQLLPKKLF